jgi:hypothetical protein
VAFAAESQRLVVTAIGAAQPQEALREDAALQEGQTVDGPGPHEVHGVLITNALIVDPWGIVKADMGIKGCRIAAVVKAGNPDTRPGVDIVIGPGRAWRAQAPVGSLGNTEGAERLAGSSRRQAEGCSRFPSRPRAPKFNAQPLLLDAPPI